MHRLTPSRVQLTAVLSLALSLVCAGCEAARGNLMTPSTSPVSTIPATSPPTNRTDAATKETTMRIQITVGQQHFEATLAPSAAAHDLVAQLPLTIEMIDHGQVEKTGPLPAPLALDGQPDGSDPDVGDLGYYAPGNDLVFYYGDQSYFPGIVILGHLDGDSAQRISRLKGTITTTIEAQDD